MKTIKCNCGRDILLDDEMVEQAIKLSWNCDSGRTSVRHTTFPAEILNMSELVMGGKLPGMLIDHRDLNTHNNQKANLRHATKQQNSFNRHVRKGSQTGYKGVAFDAHCKLPFRAYIQKPDKTKLTIGRFSTSEAAALAYNEKAKEFFGEFAYLNVILPPMK